MFPRLLTLLTVTAIALLAAGCGSADEAIPADAQRITVSFGDSLVFDPPAFAVQAGRPVVLTVRNTGSVDHDFYLRGMPARDVKNVIEGGHGHGEAGTVVGHPKAGGDVTIRFTPTTAGTYEFWCSVTGHKDAGMVGAITVT